MTPYKNEQILLVMNIQNRELIQDALNAIQKIRTDIIAKLTSVFCSLSASKAVDIRDWDKKLEPWFTQLDLLQTYETRLRKEVSPMMNMSFGTGLGRGRGLLPSWDN